MIPIRARTTLLLCLALILAVLSGCSVHGSNASSQPTAPELPSASLKPRPSASAPSSPKPDPSENVELIPYTGVVEHIFFHPLIVYPQLAFDKDSLSDGYNEWFTTIPEFKRMLEAMYKNDFMLVHLEDIYEEQTNGLKTKIAKKTLMLPKGKKPLVISIDDLNYYEYMIKNGNAYKLVLDADGDVATYSVTPQGDKVVSRDNDVIPLLDRFVEAHPDFSLDGAKGVIALTGYEGILGYRTQRDSPDREAQRKEVRPIIARLKETGWTFGSHSYGHINLSKVSLNRLKKDTEEWKDEVEPLVGATALFFYPHGARVDYGSAKFNYLVASGYRVISAVGPTSYTKVIDGAYTMDRRHMDGIALIQQPKTLMDLFDPAKVLDTVNRPAEYWKQHS